MSEPVKATIIAGIVSITVSLISTYGTLASKKAELDLASQKAHSAQSSIEAATRAANDAKTELTKLTSASLRAQPNFDSDWINLKQNCDVIEKNLPNHQLPLIVTAYYKLTTTGEIFPFGINQYDGKSNQPGNEEQTNGVLMDFDPPNRKLYIRLPCGPRNNNVVHLGWFTSRNGTTGPGEKIMDRKDVQFRVITWQ